MFKEFIKNVKKYSRVGVFSHIRPDGDCIGSQVALSIWLQKNGIEVIAFNDDDISENLIWLTNYFPVKKATKENTDACDLFIVVDGNAPHRFGSYEDWQKEKRRPVFMIDHHPNPEDEFDLSISVDDASSTCELIYNLFKEHDIDQIDENVAKALYTGLITDTGSLQFDSVKPETMDAAAELLRRGEFKPNLVAERVFSNQTLPQLQLLSLSLGTVQLFENNQIAVMTVTKEMLDDTGTTNADTGGFVNYPLSITGIKAAILLKDLDDDGVKMSLRSKSDVDVNIWARELGGGGHKKAAGAWHPGPLEKAISETVQIGSKQIQKLELEEESTI
ncbi:bifunctional oligoribonuclease/PAP phosphatase NrnA [Rhodohalobacter sp. SW132]|uniref:DHH family phosphoesterase n=1 Tax=Rhodohalobacter sp. SW132 TaxID=2293433 RepID=UPI000E288B1E|nr:bifunctional oligoribonuclease/PAP phosphatase NrnA [Rhodohalobacter sp. SW132]REL24563.1 bifunctional oligoribonuclease/PAP phosphatase NrnA [Rhodohalobacter sp. SW132]